MSSILAFCPGASASRSVNGSSQRVALPAGSGTQFRILNDGTTTCFFKAGDSSVTAAITDTPILAGTSEVMILDGVATHIAAINDGTAATLRITRGEGQ